jgi:hypothetical protein
MQDMTDNDIRLCSLANKQSTCRRFLAFCPVLTLACNDKRTANFHSNTNALSYSYTGFSCSFTARFFYDSIRSAMC